jgi:hypothetical protein
MTLPEQDSWNNHQDYLSFTSASFVISAYLKMGLFTDEQGNTLDINAAEFTVADVY